MFAAIRRYTPKAGAVAKSDFDELSRRIEKDFVPMIQEIQGFHCYYALNVNDKELVTISLFESKSGATESTQRAADFLKGDPLRAKVGSPEVLEGNLMVMKEAAIPA
jgi:hypothetical protein